MRQAYVCVLMERELEVEIGTGTWILCGSEVNVPRGLSLSWMFLAQEH